MTRIQQDITPQSDADGIAQAQTLSAGGAQDFNLNGILISDSIFTVTNAAHLIDITSAGNDLGRTFTVYGYDSRDVSISEEVTGASGATATTTKAFKVVNRVSSDDDTAGAVTIGVTGICYSNWIPFVDKKYINIGFDVILSTGANLTYSVEYTNTNLNLNTDLVINSLEHQTIKDLSASIAGNLAFPATFYNWKVKTFTSGTINFTSVHAYN